MDPFLEDPAYWLDFQAQFVNSWCEAVANALPQNYEARLVERVFLIEHDPDGHKLSAHVEPVGIPLLKLEGPRETYIEILHQPQRSLVAVLELLSPTNKAYPWRDEYLAKRMALIRQNVHVVELDLLLGGHRLPMQSAFPPADYYYFVSHGDLRHDCHGYYWNLKQPLPKLPVPLGAPDLEIRTDLGAVFNIAYERGQFQRRINYLLPPPTTLRDDDKRWAQVLVTGR
jgi:hypothetical protein